VHGVVPITPHELCTYDDKHQHRDYLTATDTNGTSPNSRTATILAMIPASGSIESEFRGQDLVFAGHAPGLFGATVT
jgi:hypothetical protein